MTRLEALKKLAEKVEAGEWGQSAAWKVFGIGVTGRVERAFNGSLDAAIALHDALLPDAPAQLTDMRPYGGSGGWLVSISWNKDKHQAANENLARAWLLAILRALIEKEKTDDQ